MIGKQENREIKSVLKSIDFWQTRQNESFIDQRRPNLILHVPQTRCWQ